MSRMSNKVPENVKKTFTAEAGLAREFPAMYALYSGE